MQEPSDAELAARTAATARRMLIDLRAAGRLSGAALGAQADLRANRLILAALARWRPGDAILSEESPDRKERLARSRLWIVDPLDGTREYVEGRDDWAVHVALAVDGEPVAGAVAVPGRIRPFRSDDAPAPALALKRGPVILISRTRPPPEAEPLAAALGGELRQAGSAGAKAMAVVAGDADIYFHSGGQHEWDNCAPVAVAKAAGFHVSRRDGAPIVYNQEVPYVADLLICRADLAQRALDALARF